MHMPGLLVVHGKQSLFARTFLKTSKQTMVARSCVGWRSDTHTAARLQDATLPLSLHRQVHVPRIIHVP